MFRFRSKEGKSYELYTLRNDLKTVSTKIGTNQNTLNSNERKIAQSISTGIATLRGKQERSSKRSREITFAIERNSERQIRPLHERFSFLPNLLTGVLGLESMC